MSNKFEQQYLCKFKEDDEYEDYLARWIAYHRHADNLGYVEAMKRYGLRGLNFKMGSGSYKKFQRAKLEAVRIVEYEEREK